MNPIIIAVIILGLLGAICALLLKGVSKKFEIFEDPHIAKIQDILPGANCGGCGFPGCSGFATACSKAKSLDGLVCTVGGNEVMNKIAAIMGEKSVSVEPNIAVMHCNGISSARPHLNNYDGTKSCTIASALYGGETNCSYGCLGFGDCVAVCNFNAIYINDNGIAEIDEKSCVACGACVKACPKNLIEIRKKGPKFHRIFVCCSSKDKGAIACKACKNACIGCGKCQKECTFEAITIENNLAYIDQSKCRLCRKCVEACPTGAIHEINFPQKNHTIDKLEPADNKQ